ncbi:condensation domain-containing protein, partial [Aquabacterium sp. CECT 9606]|uniref:condensation domain-containing protein n=1 Tax=Aquabacterium sp. CECT 9606 TaxID=2845822 RepID=UPI001E349981
VVVGHGALANYVQAVLARLALPGTVKSLAMVSTVAADLGHTSLFGALCSGRTLHLISAQRAFDPDAFAQYMHAHQVEVLKIVPSHLHALMQAARPEQVLPRHTLVVGGEATSWRLLDQIQALSPGCRVVNHYGPTETTVGVLTQAADESDRDAPQLTIGHALDHAQAFVLDAQLHRVPQGASGELYIGGLALARGYQAQPAQTAQRFVPHPWLPGERLYRTGDRVRQLADSSLVFLGRVDDQVKIRGYRVEPGEIAALLRTLPGVREAEVTVAQTEDGRAQLHAYAVAQPGQTLQGTTLREALARELPDYMVPVAVMVLAALPLNANGKVDRKALPQPVPEVAERFEAPQGEAETLLAAVWAEVLGIERVGRQDNFFELGGDSILTLQIVARARKRGLRLTPRQLMEGQTVAAVAAVAQTKATAAVASQAAPEAPQAMEPTPVQAWFLEQAFAEPAHWNQSLLLTPTRAIDAAHLRAAFGHLVAHHEALRSRFAQDSHGPWRITLADHVPAETYFECIDLSQVQDANAAITQCGERLQRSLNLSQGPLLRAAWMDLGPARGARLLVVAHHLVVDGVSWRVILEDLQTLYSQLSAGQAIDLPAKTTSHAQWSRALLSHAQSEAMQTELAYWQSLVGQAEPSLPSAWPNGENTVASVDTVEAVLSTDLTTQLLRGTAQAYRTQINDLLLTALARTLCGWTGRDSVLVELEGHGREEGIDATLDLTRSVGWFTSLYPIRLHAEQGDPGAAIKAVKEQQRAVPGKGLGYGVLRYLSKQGKALREGAYPQITFNYLGQFDASLQADGLWRLADEPAAAGRSPVSLRRSWFDVTASVRAGQLHMAWTYSRSLHDHEEVAGLLQSYQVHLEALIAHCSSGAAGLTPSDVPLSGLNQHQLDALALPAVRVDDLYPLSPMQEGMLFHSVYEPSG